MVAIAAKVDGQALVGGRRDRQFAAVIGRRGGKSRHGITLEVRPASFRKLRGPTYVAVIADELAFWYVDAAYANPDVEILNAVEPGLATTGGPLILASSPHARRGVLWEVFKRHHGAGSGASK